jgi:carbon-monoxide dehydrogenase large subunit
VVAESLAQARDAAELIELEIRPLPAVTDEADALALEAPQLHDEAPGNLALDFEAGDRAAVDRAFEAAAYVTRLELRNNRVVVAAMESRAAVAEYDSKTGRLTLHVPAQGVFGLRNGLAKLMGVAPEKLRVRAHDVGGSFGMKSSPYPEYAPLLVAARRLGRPVKWCDERSDSFVSDQHGRGSAVEVAGAFDAAGQILAARVSGRANLGAYLSTTGPHMSCGNIVRNFPGAYRLPALHVETKCAFTNSTPIGAYRGAGRPEGVYYMERLMDAAAAEMGIDRVELRRRNLVRPDEMPYAAVSGLTYDSGDFPAILDEAVARADRAGFEARHRASAEAGKLRGLGIACYLEVTAPPGNELGELRFEDDGTVTILSGTQDQGQGHAATFAQILTSRLGVPFDRIRLFQGDSDRLVAGGGTGGSKSVIIGGGAILEAADEVIVQGRRLAGHVLEAAVEDIAFEHGEFRIAGTDRRITVLELATRVRESTDPPGDLPQSLDAQVVHEGAPSAFPNGCHVAEVEIEPETGRVRVVGYVVVDDFGTLINPMLVEGQVHGGIVQGLGQALMEETVYDGAGQLLAGSFLDYAMPRADEVPDLRFASHPVPATTNALGAKGCGEAGTSGALPAIMNAVVDALSARGVGHIDMPATPERVWAAINGRR